MTGKELMEIVAQMGFAKTLDDNEPYFYQMTSLSLLQISRHFPLVKTITVEHKDGAEYYTEYDVGALCDDFRSFPEKPLRLGSLLLQEGRDFLIEGSRVRLALGHEGNLEIRYCRRPCKVNADTLHKELDISPEALHLLPLLVSSYLWADERAELASHYLALFRSELSEAKKERFAHQMASYHCGNGWDKG
ncbi:MAG: hypothetical protein J6K61_04905 [Clostridia bacterium]|nr:hypothetical protein [Clostridia bacterium]